MPNRVDLWRGLGEAALGFAIGSLTAEARGSTGPEGVAPEIVAPELAAGVPVKRDAPAAAPAGDAPAAACEAADCEPGPHQPGAPQARQPMAVYLALLGPATGVGLGFDYTPIPDVAVGGGIGGLAVCIFVCESFWTPWVNASMLIGDDHNLELGAGLSVWFDDDLRVVPSPLVAYRYQPTDGGFFFRLSVNGLITFDHDISIVPWPGLALGGTWLN